MKPSLVDVFLLKLFGIAINHLLTLPEKFRGLLYIQIGIFSSTSKPLQPIHSTFLIRLTRKLPQKKASLANRAQST